jgi:hypothetical protein
MSRVGVSGNQDHRAGGSGDVHSGERGPRHAPRPGLGAAIGAATGDAGIGAAVGAAGGLVTGSAIGAGTGQAAAQGVQRRFDAAYEQCMYAKGNQIPDRGGTAAACAVTADSRPPLHSGESPAMFAASR